MLNIKPKLLHYLHRNTKTWLYMARSAFTVGFLPPLSTTPRCTAGSVGPVNGTNKDVCGARLLPAIFSTYPVDWVCLSLTEDTALLSVSYWNVAIWSTISKLASYIFIAIAILDYLIMIKIAGKGKACYPPPSPIHTQLLINTTNHHNNCTLL